MAGLLKARRVGIRLRIDELGRHGVDDLEEPATLANLEAEREARIGLARVAPEMMGNRHALEQQRFGEILPLAQTA